MSKRTRRPAFDYTAVDWPAMAALYIEGASGTEIARLIGSTNPQAVIAHLRPHVEAAGGMMRTRRKNFDYTAVDWPALAERYMAGESARQLTAAIGAGDHKAVAAHLQPHVEAAGGEMRDQGQSQNARRALEKLTTDDLKGSWDYTLGRTSK